MNEKHPGLCTVLHLLASTYDYYPRMWMLDDGMLNHKEVNDVLFVVQTMFKAGSRNVHIERLACALGKKIGVSDMCDVPMMLRSLIQILPSCYQVLRNFSNVVDIKYY